ncbi:MAG: DsbA family protein [Nanoarchaeota archaeon]
MDDVQQANKSDEKVSLEFSKTTLWQIISGVLGILLVISIFTSGFGFSSSNSGTGAAVINNQPSGNNIPTGPVAVSADNDPFKGSKDAAVTIIEFSDFQCPFCKRFFDQTLSQIEKNYVDTGKVKFVYRDFPLDSIHPQARPAALSAECANEQGKFWEYHDLLFQKQDEWVAVGASSFKQYAKDLGLDSSKFDSCFDSRKYEKEVQSDLDDGVNVGVQGTPAFFINGILVSGAQPYAAFQAAIEQALAS